MEWILVHEVISAIGLETASGISYFHVFTRCDIMSDLRGKVKKSAWQTWNVSEDVSETFINLSQHPKLIFYLDLQRLKRFIVLMNDRSSTATIVDEARLDLFVHKQRPYNSILPTQVTLREHAKHVAYQAGIIWIQATISNPNTRSPTEWRWTQKGEMADMFYTTTPYCSSVGN